METLSKLIDIAEYLGLQDVVAELKSIDFRRTQQNASLILPLVGEFSSGKTTLINSLTDSKALETATKPTTATIYEVHFGCDSCHAKVLNEKGELVDVNNIAELKNDELADAKVVTVFDTSTKVPATTILVDTPGLSSPDPKHKQTLVNFLPKADGILLVSDINQQITRSLTDFIEMMKLSKRPIFLVLTKSDTKSSQDIESAKKYISDNCQIPLKQVAVVSAAKDNLSELYSLLDSIQKDKNNIIKVIDAQRIKNVINVLINHIEELLKASSSDKELDEAVRKCQYELDKISKNIEHLVNTLSDDIQDAERNVSRKFEDVVSSKLNTLVAGKSNNFDQEAVSMINSTASLLMNEYKTNILNMVREKSKEQKGTDEKVYLNPIDELDLSNIQISGLSYNLDLNNMGHEYDGWIKTGVIAAAAIGTAAVVMSTGGGAAIAAAATADNLIEVADTVTDVGSIVSNTKTTRRIEKAVEFATDASSNYQNLSNANQQMGQEVGNGKGMIDSLVGLVTDKVVSKPQRVRAVRNYIDSSLSPEFKESLENISQQLISNIRSILQNQAHQTIEQKKAALNQLKTERKEKKDLFEQKMNQLREHKTYLLTI